VKGIKVVKTFFCILFLPIVIFSQYQHRMCDEAISSFEGVPSTIIEGVNVITGEYLIQEDDLKFNTPIPFSYKRLYSSLLTGPSPFYDLWGNNHESTLGVNKFYINQTDITVGESSGGCRHFCKKKNAQVKLHERAYRHGYTNTGKGQISAQNNPENYTFDINKYKATITKGDGTVVQFGCPENIKKREWYHLLLKEIMPSGHYLEYTYYNEPYSYYNRSNQYDQRSHFKDITLKSPTGKTLAWIKNQFDSKTHSYSLTSSEGHNVNYERKVVGHISFQKERILNKIENHTGISSSFDYVGVRTLHQESFKRLRFIEKPNERKLLFHYYSGGNKGETGRIKHLEAPAGPNNTNVFTHTFLYNCKIGGGSQYKQEYKSGVTTALDAYKNKVVYHYDTAKRLSKIENFQKEALYTTEIMNWSNKYSEQEGRLTCTILEDSNKNKIKQLDYTYNTKGNITKKRLFGDLCGVSLSTNQGFTNFSSNVRKANILQEPSCIETFTYIDDQFNLISTHTNSKGITTQNNYLNGFNLLTSQLKTQNEQILTRHFWEYDQDHFLVKEIIDDGNSPNKDNLTNVTFRKIIKYTIKQSMPAVGLPEKIEELYYNTTTQQEQLLRYTKKTYNERSFVTLEEAFNADHTTRNFKQIAYNQRSQPTSIETNEGRWMLEYDSNGNLTKTIDPLGNLEENTYDCINRLTIQKTTDLQTGQTRTKTNTYDYNNKLTSTTNEYGITISYEYDSLGRKTAETYQDGTVKTFTYDYFNNITSETFEGEIGTHTTFTIRNKPALKQYPDGTTEAFQYHPCGDLEVSKDRYNNYTEVTNDWQGRPTQELTYSQDGELINEVQKTYSNFQLLTEKDITGNRTYYQYDFAGRLILQRSYSKNNILLYSTKTTYDDFDLPIHKIEYSDKEETKGTQTHTTYNLQDLPSEQVTTTLSGTLISHTKTEYNINKKPIKEHSLTSKGWSTTTTTYNKWGEVTSQTDPLGYITTTTYDKQVITVTDPLGQQTITYRNIYLLPETIIKNSSTNTILSQEDYKYDSHNNKQSETHQVIENGVLQRKFTCSYLYDELNNLLQINREGQITVHKYQASQLTEVTKPDGMKLYYTYTPLGMVKELYSSDQSINYYYSYDIAGNLIHVQNTSRSYDPEGRVISEQLENGLSVQKEYDLIGNLITLTYPDQSKVFYDYEGKLLKKITRNEHTRTIDNYLPGAIPHSFTDDNTIKTTYSYDLMQRLSSVEGPLEGQLSYTPTGNLNSYNSTEKELQYSYDSLYQLNEEKDEENTTQYNYDSLNNRTSKDLENYKINHLNQVIKDGQTDYRYDLNGNLIQKTEGILTWSYSYDPLNRLISVTTPENKEVTFIYDPFNRLITKKTEEETLHFIYNDQQEIGEGNTVRILLPNVKSECGATVGIEKNSEFQFVYHDPFGNITLYDGTLTHYSAFGESNYSTQNSPWGYSGKRFDVDLDLIYFGIRYYSPTLGRWITQDPIGSTDGPNLYAYVHNNPLTHHDAYGLLDEAIKRIPERDWSEVKMDIMDSISALGTPLLFQHSSLISSKEFTPYSKYYELGKQELPSGGMGFINGINTTYSEAIEGASYLSKLSGEWNLGGVYNPTFNPASDVISYLADRMHIRTTTQETKLHRQWDLYFDTRTTETPYLQIAHSRGCAITNNALLSYNKERASQVMVFAICPAAYIKNEICHSAFHLVSRNDKIPAFAALGINKSSYTIKVVEPHNEASKILDHALFSPTFTSAIHFFLNQYIEDYGNVQK
jgi:RHS repeat-associated protein